MTDLQITKIDLRDKARLQMIKDGYEPLVEICQHCTDGYHFVNGAFRDCKGCDGTMLYFEFKLKNN